MNMDAITIQDCLAMNDILGKATIINDGHVVGFEKENGIEAQ
jgi:hypothetical protein